jgi:hypothetical protein
VSNLAFGGQACYGGPRLYDTDRTRDTVKKWVSWYKTHRDILESDLIHGRRADGRDLDWMLHVNPLLPVKGMLVVFNPLDQPMERTLAVNLYYTGLKERAVIVGESGEEQELLLNRNYTVPITVQASACGFTWYKIR